MAAKEQLNFPIGGVSVKFPYNPYPPQLAMMSKIIKALTNSENALLESPTGSGKSLALLCSALAWQKNEFKKILEEETQKDLKSMQSNCHCSCQCHIKMETVLSSTLPLTSSASAISALPSTAGTLTAPIIIADDTDTTNALSSRSTPSKFQLPTMLLSGPVNSSLFIDSGNIPNTVGVVKEEMGGVKQEVRVAEEKVGMVLKEEEVGMVNGSVGVMKEEVKQEVEEEVGVVLKEKEVGIVNGVVKEEVGVAKATELGGVVHKEKEMKSDDDDFKPMKKRFRVPTYTAGPSKKKMKHKVTKGIVYEKDGEEEEEEEDHPELTPDNNGQAKWRMEFTTPGGVVPDIGIPQSQIMDTGAIAIGDETSSSSICVSKPANVSPAPTQQCTQCSCSSKLKSQELDRVKRQRCPTIYYATRTHKQISQISREMRKTAYAETPMDILASREHTCIHPQVSKSKNKNDECRKLLDYDEGVSCRFFHQVQQKLGSQAQLRQLGLSTAWDIEDLNKLGNKVKACPYFSTRGLKDDADIIFCPYNYLIDPLIRDQMLIDVENKIIIFDEAHNMEDCARDAASLTINSMELTEVTDEMKDVLGFYVHNCRPIAEAYKHLDALIKAILRWINMISETLTPRGYEQSYGVWSGEHIIPIVDKHFGINEITLGLYKKNLEEVVQSALDKNSDRFDEQGKRHQPEPTLSMLSIGRIKSIVFVMDFILKENKKYLMDYRISMLKTMLLRPSTNNWIKRGKRKSAEKVWVYTLNFWCMNPAVAFQELTQCRSIILTSGTLSPMSTFASELGVTFPIQLEANHVVHESQTWVRSISCGPTGILLNATYHNSETYEFKDELGLLVLGVCETIPYGILCFMSSYNMLEKLTTRWQETGTWDKISSHKHIVSEPRSGGKEAFENAMTTFYQVISEVELPIDPNRIGSRVTGALFLAVCRGKVSEGLDFSDNNARAVITVGIPFPNFKNKQIELKREYNNDHYRQRGLLNGSEWYEIQAYRALNQALGRCIRHKRDWGALLLVDARYSKGNHYTKGLSKWIKRRIQHEVNFKESMISLKSFAELMMKGNPDASTCMNDSKSTSVLERSSSSVVSVASSMMSPPATSSVNPSKLFLINSPGETLPEHFEMTSPDYVPRSDPFTSTPVAAKPTPVLFSNSTHYNRMCNQLVASFTPPNVISEEGIPCEVRKYPEFTPISDILKLESAIADSQLHDPVLILESADADSEPQPQTTATSLPVNSNYEDASTLMYNQLDDPLIKDSDRMDVVPSATGKSTNTAKIYSGSDILPASVPDSPPIPSESPLMFDALPVGENSSKNMENLNSLIVQNQNGLQVDIDATPPMVNSPRMKVSESPQREFNDNEESCERQEDKVVSSSCNGTKTSSFGQPKLRRNLRRSNRLTSSPSKFQDKSSTIFCLCGEVLASKESVVNEKCDLKVIFSKFFGDYRMKDIQSSKLWNLMKQGKEKKIEVFLVPENKLHYSQMEGSDQGYNSVWDEKLSICYGFLHCQARCDHFIGVLIHATKLPTSDQLIGKAIIHNYPN